jgi:glycosyltransferase 2 family protein
LKSTYTRLVFPLIIALCLSFIGIFAVFQMTNKEKIIEAFRDFNYQYAGACFLLVFCGWLCNGLRLHYLAKGLGHDISVSKSTRITLTSEFGFAATPSGFGGTLFKYILMRNSGVQGGHILSIMASDLVMDSIFFGTILILIIINFILGNVVSGFDWGAIGMLILKISAVVLILSLISYLLFRYLRHKSCRPGFRRHLGREARWKRVIRIWTWRAKKKYRKLKHEFGTGIKTLISLKRGTLVLVFLIMSVQWCCRYGVLPLVLYAVGMEFDILHLFIIQGLLFMFGFAIVIPGGAGGIEPVFTLVIGSYIPDMTSDLIPIVLVIWRSFTYYLYIIGGGVAFIISVYSMRLNIGAILDKKGQEPKPF